MLRQRLFSAAIALPILFVAIWFGYPWFSIVVALAALLGVIEFYRLAAPGWHPLAFFGAIWTLLFIFNAHSGSPQTTAILVTSAVVVSLVLVPFQRSHGGKIFLVWAWTLAGVFYLGWLLSHWVLLMSSDVWAGRDWVLVALFSTFAVDSSAYFVGRALGRHKLAPSISPAKTWEGAVGGLVGAMAAVVLLALFLGIDMAYWQLVFMGFMVGLIAQIGDLAESKLKRGTGFKESGSLIPGHGGLLDRLDSVVFTGVVVYYCLKWFVG